jgi:hypothetical protein
MKALLRRMLDEAEFLSPFGVRALSRFHAASPYVFEHAGNRFSVGYVPGESETGLFGGNSNWRGPVWFPVNYLLVEALERYHSYYGDSLVVEAPMGSGNMLTLREVSMELQRRLGSLFLADSEGNRPVHGGCELYANDPHFRELVLFYEYFHGDSGRGVGASHQTGWTALAVRCLEDSAKARSAKDPAA